MTEHLIVEVMKTAKDHFGRNELAALLGLTKNQVTDVCGGRIALPFVAALKLAELLQLEPLPLLCANEHLLEKNPEKSKYLEAFFNFDREAHNFGLRQLLALKYGSDDYSELGKCQQESKPVLQGANSLRFLPSTEPRTWIALRKGSLVKKSPWALRPIPRHIEKLEG